MALANLLSSSDAHRRLSRLLNVLSVCFLVVASLQIALRFQEEESRADTRAANAARMLLGIATETVDSLARHGAERLPEKNRILDASGVDSTLDRYLIDADGKLFTPSRYQVAAEERVTDPTLYQLALRANGKPFMKRTLDYRGIPVVGAYILVSEVKDKQGRPCVAAVEIDDVDAHANVFRWWHLVGLLLSTASLVIGGVLWAWLSPRVSKLVLAMRQRTEAAEASMRIMDSINAVGVEAVLAAVHDGGIGVTDRKGVILACNPNFARMNGKLFTRDVVGTNVDEYCEAGPEAHRRLREGFSSDIRERPVVARMGGKPLPVALSVSDAGRGYVFRIVAQACQDCPSRLSGTASAPSGCPVAHGRGAP